jgi:hypothetical protein
MGACFGRTSSSQESKESERNRELPKKSLSYLSMHSSLSMTTAYSYGADSHLNYIQKREPTLKNLNQNFLYQRRTSRLSNKNII